MPIVNKRLLKEKGMYFVSKVSPPFFLLGAVCLLTALILRPSEPLGPRFLVFLLFGFLGMILTGAMYQIIPNSQGRKLAAYPLAFISFPLALLSFLLFIWGEMRAGSLLLMTSEGIFFLQAILTVRNWSAPTVKFLGLSAFFLFVSTFLLFLHFWTGTVGIQPAVHSLTVGAMLSAIYGVEVAWIPMLLMESLSVRSAGRLFTLKALSTTLLVAGFLVLSYPLIALFSFLEIVASIYFFKMVFSLFRKRRSPAPVPPVLKIFLVALFFLPPGLLLGLFMASHPSFIPKAVSLHIDFMVFGVGLITIIGGTSHLLPRIIWQWTKRGTISDHLRENVLHVLAYLSPLAVLLGAVLNYMGHYPLGSLVLGAAVLLWIRAVFLPAIQSLWRSRHGSLQIT
jgi:hypothetical protein